MQSVCNRAKAFILREGTELQREICRCLLGEGDQASVIRAMEKYQNKDGGWAHGLEIEYQGPVSSPMTTAAALGHICMYGLKDTYLLDRTLRYLENTQRDDGSWDDPTEVLEYPLPPYMGPGKSLDYKTGMIVKWLKRLGLDEPQMITRGVDYLVRNFERFSQADQFFSAVAYINVFGNMPDLAETPRIMAWASGVLSPVKEKGGQKGPPNQMTLAWPQAMGMLVDDDPMLIPLKGQVWKLIQENQLDTGGWSHPFGTYNAVWAANAILRFLVAGGFTSKAESAICQ